jgi:squalene cyclase
MEDRVTAAIEAVITFLLNSRTEEGWWRDFYLTVPGVSDEWVTAYVGTALAAVPDERAYQAACSAWSLLRGRRQPILESPHSERRKPDGWGYNATLPADADSTGWALRLARAVGAGESMRARLARQFVEQHVHPHGGVAPYRIWRRLPGFPAIELSRIPGHEGWCGPQVCVTATVAALEEFRERTRSFLRNAQCQDGRWKGYWWCDDEHTTALVAEALSVNAQPEDLHRIQSAVQWASGRLGSQGAVYSAAYADDSPFATAACVRALVLADDSQGVREPLACAVQWLIEHQRPDGSWPPSARHRVPPPDVVDPEEYPSWTVDARISGTGSIILDAQSNFTTATILAALAKVRA